jgi:hypothetical protein
MTYCGPTWVSDWGWDKVYPRIKLISSWDLGDAVDPGAPEMKTVLYGLIGEDGEEHWGTAQGYLTPEELTDGESLQLTAQSGVHELPASVSPMGDSDGVMIAVELPDDISDLSTVTDAVRYSNVLTVDVDVDGIRAAE